MMAAEEGLDTVVSRGNGLLRKFEQQNKAAAGCSAQRQPRGVL